MRRLVRPSLVTRSLCSLVVFCVAAVLPLPGEDVEPSVREDGQQPRQRQDGQPRTERRPTMSDDEPQEGLEEGISSFRSSPNRDRLLVHPRWKLGVFAYDTEAGVFITRVVPNSPASRVGLERGDRVVTVSGYQIGYVGRFVYPLGDELQQRADRNGRVRLLVQNCRNAKLVNIDVQLEGPRFRNRPPYGDVHPGR